MTAAAPRGELVGIQYLRAVAAIMVVFHHVRDMLPGLHDIIPTTALQGGVDIFFVISGFIMTYTVAQKPITAATFFERRLARIVPLYWTMTLFTAALALGAPHLFKDTKFTLGEFITSLLFIPAYNPGVAGQISPILNLGWTLNYEKSFYLLFAAAIFLPPLRRAGALFAVFGLLVALLPLTHSSNALVNFYSDPIVFEFVFGCVIGALCTRSAQILRPMLAWALLATAIFAMFRFEDVSTNRAIARGLAAAVIVLSTASLDLSGAFAATGPVGRIWKTLGDASYSIYLTHLYPLILFQKIWLKCGAATTGLVPMAVFVVAAGTATVGASVLIYFLVEKPVTTRARSLIKAMKPRSHTLPAPT